MLLILCWIPNCLAITPEEHGLAIAKEMDRRTSGFVDMTAAMQMILRNQEGRESQRLMRSYAMETDADGDKTLTIFAIFSGANLSR